MANQNSKKKVQVWMDPALVAQLDGIAAREGKTRAPICEPRPCCAPYPTKTDEVQARCPHIGEYASARIEGG